MLSQDSWSISQTPMSSEPLAYAMPSFLMPLNAVAGLLIPLVPCHEQVMRVKGL